MSLSAYRYCKKMGHMAWHNFCQSVLGFDSVASYLTNMEKTDTWGDGIILSAASMYFKRPIKVLFSSDHADAGTTTGPIVIADETNIAEKPIILGFVECTAEKKGGGKANHYVSLVPVNVHDQLSTVIGMY